MIMSSNSTAPHQARTAMIIEDDPDIGRLISDIFQHTGFTTRIYTNGEDAIESLQQRPESLAIVTIDVMLGNGIDGFETIRRVRALSDAYIIMMTSLSEENDVVEGLAAGADQYIRKPFRPHEFRASLKAYLRRADQPVYPDTGFEQAIGGPVTSWSIPKLRPVPRLQPAASAAAAATQLLERVDIGETTDSAAFDMQEYESSWIEYNGLRLNTLSRELLVNNAEVQLTKTEFNLMTLLLQSGSRVRSRANLALELRTGKKFVTNYVVTDAECRSIEVHLANLRKKLGENTGGNQWIRTVRGVGYKLAKEM
jgi:DNA-binding response OmpR family regulator